MQFSHSSIEKYKECPRKFYLHYIEKLRPILTKSPLFFGGLMDDVVGRLLLAKKVDLTPEELDEMLQVTPEEIINKACTEWSKNPKLRFSKSDLDLSLFSESDLTKCIARCIELKLDVSQDSYEAFIDACQDQLKADDFGLDEDCLLGYNAFCIKSLELKAKLFVPVIEEWIEGNVAKTLSIQEKVELNDEDDVIVGYIDMKLKMKDGSEMIWDFKTSSRSYGENDANVSQQLTIYSEYGKIESVGFLVAQKKIRKREPRVRLQEVFGTITEEQRIDCFSEITEIIDEIKEAGTDQANFPKNMDSCYKFGKCQYFDNCKYGKKKGLELKGES